MRGLYSQSSFSGRFWRSDARAERDIGRASKICAFCIQVCLGFLTFAVRNSGRIGWTGSVHAAAAAVLLAVCGGGGPLFSRWRRTPNAVFLWRCTAGLVLARF